MLLWTNQLLSWCHAGLLRICLEAIAASGEKVDNLETWSCYIFPDLSQTGCAQLPTLSFALIFQD